MSDIRSTPLDAAQDSICFAQLDDGVVVIRILGRGSFANSVELKRLTDMIAAQSQQNPGYRFIVDLAGCTTMDSTFMGVLASVGLRQKRDMPEKMTIVNVNEQNLRLMKTLGLSHFINVRAQDSGVASIENDFQTAEPQNISKADRIAHMIEAHRNLCDIDNQNNIRFESVLKYLQESLEREKEKPE